MTVPTDPATYDILKDIGLPVLTGIVGWFANQFWMSKKDRKDLEQKNYENATSLRDAHDKAYDSYIKALADFDAAPNAAVTNFVEIARAGDRYFLQLNFLCAAIMDDKVNASVRDNVMLAKIKAAADRTIPSHYETLSDISKKHGFSHPSEFRREDYSAIYAVVEKYAA